MERRWSGLVIVVTVLLAAAVIPALGGRMVSGSAAIGPIPGPPHVGDCLVQMPAATESAVDAGGAPIYRMLATEPCAGERFGDVIDIIDDGMLTRPVEVADDDGVVSYDDPNRHTCGSALAGYLASGRSSTAWNPAIVFSSAIGGPNDLQRRMGQHWVACVAYVGGADGAVTPYDGALRSSVSAALLPATVRTAAICLSSTNFFLQHTVDCRQQHPVESVAMLLTDNPVITMAGLESRCRELVGSYTGMADPTAGGRLVDDVVAVHRASDGTQAPGLVTSDETGYARCVVRTNGSRLLTGSLLHLDGRPVPWGR